MVDALCQESFFFKRVQTVEIATVDVQQLHFVRLRSLGAPAQYLQVVPKHEEKGSFFFTLFGRVITLFGRVITPFQNRVFSMIFCESRFGAVNLYLFS